MSTPTQPLGSTAFGPSLTSTPQQAGTQAGQQGAKVTGGTNVLNEFIKDPIESVGAGMYRAYTDVVSHPASAVLIYPQVLAAQHGFSDDFFNPFSKDAWDRAWHDSRNVSPGQALYKAIPFAFKSTSADEASLGYNSNDGTILWDHPDQVQSFFSHGAQKYISGGTDAAFSWYADPTVLAGHAAGVTRDLTYGKALEKTTPKTFKGVAVSGALGAIGKATGATPEGIAKAQDVWAGRLDRQTRLGKNILAGRGVQDSQFTKLGDTIEKAQAKEGPGFSAWITRQGFGQGGGASLATALGLAKSREDIDDVLAISMGDESRYQALQKRINPDDLDKALKQMGQESKTLYSQMKALGTSDPGYAAARASYEQKVADIQDIQNRLNFFEKANDVAPTLRAYGLRFNAALNPQMNKLRDLGRGVEYKSLRNVVGTPGLLPALVYNNAFVRPVRLFTGQAFKDIRPNGLIAVDDPNSFREVQAQLESSKVFTPAQRDEMVSKYMQTPSAARPGLIQAFESEMTRGIAAKYGVHENAAKLLYNAFSNRRGIMTGERYSGAFLTDSQGNQYMADTGLYSNNGVNEVTAVHPILVSQLANNLPMMDSAFMDKVIKNNARAFNALVAKGSDMEDAAKAVNTWKSVGGAYVKGTEAANELMHFFNSVWKANVLVRLGYGVRAISDDFMGQIARFGAAQLALNAAQGIAGSTARKANAINSWMHGVDGYDMRLKAAETDAVNNRGMTQWLQEDRDALASRKYSPRSKSAIKNQQVQLKMLDDQIADYKAVQNILDRSHAQIHNEQAKLTDKHLIMPNGQVLPGFSSGPEGAIALRQNAGLRSAMDVGLGGTASTIWGHLRSLGWRTINLTDPEYDQAWFRAVQHEIANDPLAMQFVNGASIEDGRQWLKEPEGREHFKALRIPHMTHTELAESVHAHVTQYLPRGSQEMEDVYDALKAGADDKKMQSLLSKVRDVDRPMQVHGEQTKYARGASSANRIIDNLISGWYKYMNQIPTEVLSRNPLAASLYQQHTLSAYKAAERQGITELTNDHIQRIAKQSRQMAIEDVKRFTYNMDHETKLAYMFRNTMPFFGPMQEPIARWARIAQDKPDSIGKFMLMYNAPLRLGMEEDSYGNPIDANGYTTDPVTGEKTLVPTDQRQLKFQLPAGLAKTLGVQGGWYVDPNTGKKVQYIKPALTTRLSSLPLPFRNDPWYNPGEGPMVQMAVNKFVQDKPKLGDMAQSLGILPTGVKKNSLDIIGGQLQRQFGQDDPKTLANMQLQIMQDENYKYVNGLRKTEPTWPEIEARAKHEQALNAHLSGEGLISSVENLIKGNPEGALANAINFAGVNTKVADPYQMYRTAYQALQNSNPSTARQIFYQKYGSSAYGFTQSIMANAQSGVPATAQAVAADKQFGSLVQKFPDLAGLIIGPAANGSYSPTANEMQRASGQRTPMTAQDAWKQEQTSLGWQQYQSVMASLTSQMVKRGGQTLNDNGMEDLLATKQAFVKSMTAEFLPDGKTVNPYRNQAWSDAYYDQNPYKDDEQAAELEQVIQDPRIQKLITNPNHPRPDLEGLAAYLAARSQVMGALESAQQETDHPTSQPDINTQANQDIKKSFQSYIMYLIQNNPSFQSLHDRYLSNDMFDHYDGTDQTNSIYGGE